MTIQDKTRPQPLRPLTGRRGKSQWPTRHFSALLILLWASGACYAESAFASARHVDAAANGPLAAKRPESAIMYITVGARRFAFTLADTDAARSFAAQLPLTLRMADLNGNEKDARLPKALPTDEVRPGTIRNGDLMLYGSNTLVLFYLGFESSYAYTRIGRVNDPDGLAEALGKRDVRVTFAKEKM